MGIKLAPKVKTASELPMKTNLLHLCKRISVNIHKTFTYIEESFFCRPIAMTSLVNTWKPKWRSERPDANPLASLRQKDFYPACPLSAYFFSFLKISQKSDRILVLLFNDFFGYRASLTAQLLRASLLRMYKGKKRNCNVIFFKALDLKASF